MKLASSINLAMELIFAVVAFYYTSKLTYPNCCQWNRLTVVWFRPHQILIFVVPPTLVAMHELYILVCYS